MGWISLSLRKQTLKAGIAQEQLRLLQISREVRSVQRQLSYDKTVNQIDKDSELRDSKSVFDAVKDQRPDRDDYDFEDEDDKEAYQEAYNEWKDEYDDAKIEYEAEKVEINDYYDQILSELEEEAQDRQTALEDEQTTVEAQMEAMQAELESVSEQIKTDIQNSAIKFS